MLHGKFGRMHGILQNLKPRVKILLLIDSVRLEVLDVAYLDTLGAQFPTFLMRRDWLRLKLGREPLPFELFELTHTKKGTSELVDARSQGIKDRYLELVDQASQTQEGPSEPPVMDERALYYEAVGEEKNVGYMD
ncbi:putative transposase, Ptta/En/Spm, plant [Dioscorea sansibarensis]